jgi:hypothetical protein
MLFKKPIISIKDVEILLDIAFPNAQNLVNKLIDNQILALYKNPKRNRLYVYYKYLEILSKD